MPPPAILYKYRSLSSDCHEYTLRVIRDHELFYSRLSLFNDPFEGRVQVQMDGDDAVWLREFGCHRPEQRVIEATIADLENSGIREEADKIGMCCLSSAPDDLLM